MPKKLPPVKDSATSGPTTPMLVTEADAWAKLHADPPTTLHHYTTGDGLLGMLRCGRVWASSAHFMNDPEEIAYAAGIVQAVVREAAAKHQVRVKELDPAVFDRIIAFARDRVWKAPKIDQWATDTIRTFDEQGGAYVACFCSDPDLLSQWRGYGAVGGGYAVGFSAKDLATRSDAALLRRVIYDATRQREIVKRWVDAMFALDFGWRTEQKQLMEAMKTGGPKDWPSFLKALAGEGEAQLELRDKAKRGLTELNDALERFSQFMIECLVCFKNPAYAAEDEWRLIVFGRSKPKVNFRVGRGCPLPYIELDLTILDGEHRGKLPISGINYGPVHESAMVKRALKTCLEAMGYDHVTHVNQSKVPYRG